MNDINISIVFKDSRVYVKKIKEKCTKDEIFAEFVNGIKQTYPNMKIAAMDENNFDEEPANGVIKLQIDLQKYDATFYTGMYVANTKYKITILDYRHGKDTLEQSISGEGKHWNAMGLTSGKIASNKSFNEAFDKLILLLDQLDQVTTVQKSNKDELSPQNNNTKSKADRLRELKKLLDEKILTQVEFEKEKKKILDENN